MALALFLFFLVLPVVELYVIVQVAGQIGALETIGLLLLFSVAGAWLCKREGASVLRRMNTELDRGNVPAREIIDGVLVLLAGALMIVPGFITDAVGLLLLIPPIRAGVRTLFLRRLQRRIQRAMDEGGGASFRVIRVTNTGPNGSPFGAARGYGYQATRPGPGTVLDVPSHEVDPRGGGSLPPDELGQGS